jgi:hypothetical protein
MEYTINELHLFRQALDIISITGKDAKYVAQLQLKVEQHIQQLETPQAPKK